MAKFTARTTLSLAVWDAGPEHEVDMVVTFTVNPARPQTEIDPAEPSSVEDITIRLFKDKGATELSIPDWQHELFTNDRDFREWLISEAAEQIEDAKVGAAEARADDARLGL
ncbi:hypothetical protein [Aliihoeflea sp. 2WW]|uniref:hypothetical protein n=1 Tax=Aliihoeflea sp. 2WW TaxID=1381123 RepID=UPI0004B2DEDE|nr:hypothetical protein [Aliihoeflea sp. 2WW]